jgi:hypothetical protein
MEPVLRPLGIGPTVAPPPPGTDALHGAHPRYDVTVPPHPGSRPAGARTHPNQYMSAPPDTNMRRL